MRHALSAILYRRSEERSARGLTTVWVIMGVWTALPAQQPGRAILAVHDGGGTLECMDVKASLTVASGDDDGAKANWSRAVGGLDVITLRRSSQR